jgi:mitochondrial FAD-linked sulfhydryl oxidase
MNPKVWGRRAWFFIHSVALNYPILPTEKDKENYKTFFSILQYILPCPVCANNYKKYLLEVPITDDVLLNKRNLFLWTVKIHNKVNKSKGRRDVDPKYILDKYSKEYKTKLVI